MKELQLKSRGKEVFFLSEILALHGYSVVVSFFFGEDMDQAVREVQKENKLLVDGRVGPKTWSCLLSGVDLESIYRRSIGEQDLDVMAQRYGLDGVVVRAVNESCSLGRGFLVSGKPIVQFHGEVFWNELQLRGINPNMMLTRDNAHILHKRRNQKFHRGGEAEYERLELALSLSESRIVKTAAHCAVSWGAYQTPGKYYTQMGYDSMQDFLERFKGHERGQLEVFGKLLETKQYKGRSLIGWLQEKDWRKFALGYSEDLRSAPGLYRQLKRSYRHYLREESRNA